MANIFADMINCGVVIIFMLCAQTIDSVYVYGLMKIMIDIFKNLSNYK